MSIDVALSTRRDVGRDTYSLPQKKRGYAASGTSMDMALLSCAPGGTSMDMPLLSCAPGAMSTDFVSVTWIHSRAKRLQRGLRRRMAFSHPHLRSENDEGSSSARRYNINSTAVGVTKAIGKD